MNALEARVHGVNAANECANKLWSQLVPVFKQFVGTKILKADGTLLKKVQECVDALDLPHENKLHVYRSSSIYSLNYVVKTCEVSDKCAHYYEQAVYIGEIRDGVLVDISKEVKHKTDYTVAEIIEARLAYKAAKKAADEAKSALIPFDEND